MNEIQADEAGYERGWEQAEDYWRAKEQDRIIKLLEEELYINPNSNYGQQVIALIEGENK